MKKLNSKMQRNIIVAGLLIATIAVGGLLITNFKDKEIKKESEVSVTINPTPEVKVEEAEKTAVEVPKIEEKQNTTVTEKEPDTKKAVNTETTKTETTKKSTDTPKKPEPPKDTPKTKDDLTDKSKVPTYEDKEIKPQTQTETPKSGDKNSEGEVFVPGFGYVKDEGGGGQGTKVDSDGDIEKQVGNMN